MRVIQNVIHQFIGGHPNVTAICTGLSNFGINATIANRDRWEEEGCEGSLGLIDIAGGPIRWVNMFQVTTGGDNYVSYTKYIVPDPRVSVLIEEDLAGKASRFRPSRDYDIYFEENGVPMVARTVRIVLRKRLFQDFSWTGEDQGLGIIERLSGELFIGVRLHSLRGLTITSDALNERWRLSTKTREVPSQEIWNYYDAIARHLLATNPPTFDSR